MLILLSEFPTAEDWAFRRDNLLLFIFSPTKTPEFCPKHFRSQVSWVAQRDQQIHKEQTQQMQNGYFDVSCSKWALDPSRSWVFCLLLAWVTSYLITTHSLFRSWALSSGIMLNSVPILGEPLWLMLEFSSAPRSERILLTLLWHELVSSLKSTFP